MRFPSFKSVIAISIISLFPVVSHADDTNKLNEIFQKSCVKAWMERAGEASDQVEFKNFGEKYCGCASSQPLDNDKAIDKAAQVCMSQTLMKDTMDGLSDQKGLSKVTEDDIDSACKDKWALIYPKMTDKDKVGIAAYCACAKTKLMPIVKDADNLTDKDFYTKVNGVAKDCAGDVEPDKSTKPAKSQ